jgi:hypothetical protein
VIDKLRGAVMSKQKLAAAKELIKEKHYTEARAILKTMDHPTAKKWLAKLDEISPEHTKRRIAIGMSIIVGGMALLALVVFAVIVRPFSDQLAIPVIPTETPTELPTSTFTFTPPASSMPIPSSAPTITGTPTNTNTPRPTRTPIPTPTPTMVPQIQQLGPMADSSSGEIYSVEITLASTQFVSNQELERAGKVVVAVFVEVRNLGPGTMRSVNDSSFQAMDSAGALRSPIIVGGCTFDWVDLVAGGLTSGCIGFEVPVEGSLELIYAPYQNRRMEPGRFISFRIR